MLIKKTRLIPRNNQEYKDQPINAITVKQLIQTLQKVEKEYGPDTEILFDERVEANVLLNVQVEVHKQVDEGEEWTYASVILGDYEPDYWIKNELQTDD